MKPLFMWAGGKKKMLKKYEPYLPKTFDRYIEPFFGGGAMFIWAYNQNPDAKFVINDVNEGIISIYREIKNNFDEFEARLIELSSEYLPLRKEFQPDKKLRKQLERDWNRDWEELYEHHPCRRYFYFKLRHEHAYKYKDWTKAKEAATLYFLMKTGFNGIWQVNNNTNRRFGTPFGLGNQTIHVYDHKVLKWWHKALQNTEILCGDYEDVVSKWATKDSFVFMDPPYRDSFTQYNTDFHDKEQERVISSLEHCKKVGALGWLTNRDCGDDFFTSRWDHILYFDVTYTAGRRKKTEDGYQAKPATEVLLRTKDV